MTMVTAISLAEFIGGLKPSGDVEDDRYYAEAYTRLAVRAFERGDKVLVYHSSCEVPGVYGIGRVASDAYPDPSQFDKRSDYYDAKSKREEPRWLLRDIAFERKLKYPVTLATIKAHADELEGMVLLRTGNRLSVMPIAKAHYDRVLKLEGKA